MTQDKITEIINTLEKHSPDETSELGEAIASAIEVLKNVCNCGLETNNNYCPNCGQAIDWSKERK